MRDFRQRFSASVEHLHDLVSDMFDETDAVAFGASYTGIIYREGYLFKQSRRMWKMWKARYFVLRQDGLFYFKSISEKDGQPLGVVPLRRLSVHLDAITDKGKPKYCLRLGSGHFKTSYCLCCFSKDERDQWLTSLLTAISEEMVSNCRYSLKYRNCRSSSGSSTDSVLSDPSPSPTATLNSSSFTNMPRMNSLGRFPPLSTSKHGRATSLANLSELDILRASQALSSPKRTNKSSSNPLRRLKALSTLEAKGWKGSYIDLSS